ncbi:MAG: hypothetical protein QOH81_1095 [Sphingomonadales bacterium]|nr:hypothetical protein [Sphingomonadales bacterium]
MTLEFEWITLNGLGGSPQISGKQEGTLSVVLDMGEATFYPAAEISVLVDRRPDLTWAELEEQARGSAIGTLRAALEALESGTVEELRARAAVRRETNDAAQSEQWQRDLAAKIDGTLGRARNSGRE